MLVDGEDLDARVENGDHFFVGAVEEGDLVDGVAVGGSVEGLAGFDVPDDEHVFVVDASEGGEVEFVVGEREGLDEDLVELEAVDHGALLEVPDDDISLEAHVSPLSGGNVLAGA